MKITPKRIRSRVRLTNKNCSLLSLAEAVRRSTVDGFFPMAERSDDGGFEGSSNDIDPETSICHMSKVETALRGIDAARMVMAAPERKHSELSPSSSPSPEPIE